MGLYKIIFIVFPDFILAATYLIVWINPEPFIDEILLGLGILFVVEGLTIHSAGFMTPVLLSKGSPVGKIIGLLVLSIIYILFFAVISRSVKTIWPLANFLILMGKRITNVILDKKLTEDVKEAIKLDWVASTVFFVLILIIVMRLPLPRLGFTPEMEIIKYENCTFRQPYRVICGGFLYFLVLGFWEIYRPRITHQKYKDGLYLQNKER